MANRCHATDLDFRILSTLPTYLSLGSIILYIHTGHISIQNIQLQIIDIFSYGNIILTCIYPINSFIINTQIGEKKI